MKPNTDRRAIPSMVFVKSHAILLQSHGQQSAASIEILGCHLHVEFL